MNLDSEYQISREVSAVFHLVEYIIMIERVWWQSSFHFSVEVIGFCITALQTRQSEVKPMLSLTDQPITKDTENLMNQSKLEVTTCS